MTGRLILGIDLGGTEIKAAVLRSGGAVVWESQVPTGAPDGREAVLQRLLGVVRSARAAVGPEREIGAAGFAVPGVLDGMTGTVELLTNFTPEWNGFPLHAELEAGTCLPTFLINDARAATLAEHLWGAGRPFQNFACLAIGTGIGGGLVLDGKLYLGSRGAAGEIGHQTMVPDGPRCNCGNYGCLEALASGYALTRDASLAIAAGDGELAELAGSPTPTPQQVARAAARGNRAAREIYERASRWIGRALANVVCVLNVEAIVLGGGVAAAGDLLFCPVRDEIECRTVVFAPHRGGVQVLTGSLGSNAGAVGAAAWAMRHLAAAAEGPE
jgi:glucokinase